MRPSCSARCWRSLAGYLVHRLLTDTVPPPRPMAARCGIVDCRRAHRDRDRPRAVGRRHCRAPRCRSCGASDLRWPRSRRWCWRAASLARSALAAAAVLAAFSVADLGWNNAPNELTGLKPAQYEALRPDTTDETVALLKAKLKAAAAPDRRDRVELIGIGYHWPNIGLIHDFDHLFGHNPLRLMDFERATAAPDTVAGADQRQFPPLMSVLPLDAGKSVRRALHRHRRAGRADRQVAQAGRSRFRRAHQGRLRLRKSRARCRA